MGINNHSVRIIESQLPVLVNDGVIDDEDAQRIRRYYKERRGKNLGIFPIILSVFAALLVGLGIVLLIAYNWNSVAPAVKTGLVFALFLAAQALAWYSVSARKSSSWREGSALFLVLVAGASIALISLIYQIPGNFSRFLFVCIIMALPLVYLMNSFSISLFVVVVNTYWFFRSEWSPWWVFLVALSVLVAIMPRLAALRRHNPLSGQTASLSWVFTLGLVLILMEVFETSSRSLFLFQSAMLFVFLIFAGKRYGRILSRSANTGEGEALSESESIPVSHNPFAAFGRDGVVLMSFIATFEWTNKNLRVDDFQSWNVILYPGTFVLIALVAATLWFILFQDEYRLHPGRILPFLALPALALIVLVSNMFFVRENSVFFPVLYALIFNLYTLFLGLLRIWEGVLKRHLWQINHGMLIILLLVMLRFLDIDMSLMGRGIVFILLGIVFLVCSRIFHRRFKTEGEQNV